MNTPTPCKGTCGRMIRPGWRSAAEMPGTVPNRRDGYCKKCLTEKTNAGEIKTPVRQVATWTHCVHCNHKLRPHNGKVADYPGTYRHIGGGHCARCLHYGDIEITDPEGIRPSFDETQARASLEAWLADRARRLEGVHHFRADARHTELVAA